MKERCSVSPAEADILLAPRVVDSLAGKGESADLNTVTQKAFAAIQSAGLRNKVVLRCDVLPQVPATEAHMLLLFGSIVHLLQGCCLSEGSVFVHIKSIYINRDSIDLSVPAGYHPVLLSVCTNVPPKGDWTPQQNTILQECTAICTRYGGSFSIAPASGILFNITLPGKLNISSLG